MKPSFFDKTPSNVTNLQLYVDFEYIGRSVSGKPPQTYLTIYEAQPPLTDPKKVKDYFHELWEKEQNTDKTNYQKYYLKISINGFYEGVSVNADHVMWSPAEFENFINSVDIFKTAGVNIKAPQLQNNNNQ